MSTSFRPKAKIMFPNTWAVNSFLNRVKRFSNWEYLASSDERHVRVKPKGAADYILIGLTKAGGTGAITVEINAEKLGDRGDNFWIELYDYARRYRC
jgi:hypothetical protein